MQTDFPNYLKLDKIAVDPILLQPGEFLYIEASTGQKYILREYHGIRVKKTLEQRVEALERRVEFRTEPLTHPSHVVYRS